MQLTYRGVKYDYTPPVVKTTPTGETGKFRGVDIRFRTVDRAAVQQPTLDLLYRGVAYRTGTPQTAVAIPAAPAATAPAATASAATTPRIGAEERARLILMGHHRAVKQRQQSMLGRLALEVGLPADAASYWAPIQGKVHPSFWATYDRSRAAAS